ncbi:mutator type transposase [Tanacetum coccineum]|uniref:Mutator type transposase n=1 Tax=Tanacetum coccineum TaxID=301880 RepID=A0ABQ5ERS4_9ASTR
MHLIGRAVKVSCPFNRSLFCFLLVSANAHSQPPDSWKWFLTQLGDDLELYSNSNFTFITDRQKGLLPTIKTLFPAAEHKYCVRHINQNMNLQWKGRVFKDLLWRDATSTTTVYFDKAMDELKAYNIKAYEWLKKYQLRIGVDPIFLVCRANCDLLINNICEVFNRRLLEARNSPIISALEYTREYLIKRIVIVQKVIEKSQGPLKAKDTTKEGAKQMQVTNNQVKVMHLDPKHNQVKVMQVKVLWELPLQALSLQELHLQALPLQEFPLQALPLQAQVAKE